MNWIDYGARNYDASLGRWMNIDPLAQEYFDNSPYNYVANTPLVAYDPDGKRIAIVGNGEYVKSVLNYLFSLAQQSGRGAQLVMDAIKTDRTFVIFDPNDESLHGEVKNFSDDGTSEGYSTLGFDLNQAEGEYGKANGRNGKPLKKTGETTLGHELSHFKSNNKYPYDLNGEKFGPDEANAVRDENQIRREMGLPERTHYGGTNVYGKKAQQTKEGYYNLVRDKNYTKPARRANVNQFDSFFFRKTQGEYRTRGKYYHVPGRLMRRNTKPPVPNKEFSLSEKKK